MRHRHIMPVHGIADPLPATMFIQMRHDLVPEKIEIDPAIRRSTLSTAQNIAIEAARGGKVMNGKSQMEWRAICHRLTIGQSGPCGNALSNSN